MLYIVAGHFCLLSSSVRQDKFEKFYFMLLHEVLNFHVFVAFKKMDWGYLERSAKENI
jgi:hypothetical protein